jgi:hypothetical protein
MNFVGITAIVFSVVAFAVAHKLLRHRSLATRIKFLCVFALLAVPSILFAAYYLHVLPEWEWFYALRSWPGSEFLVVFLGCAGGAAAALIPLEVHDDQVTIADPLFGEKGMTLTEFKQRYEFTGFHMVVQRN